MAARERRCCALARLTIALVVLSTVALGSPARAGDGTEPVVVADKSALPRDCVSLGDVSGKHMETTPRPEKAQADAVWEARQKGATHVVTDSISRCGSNAYCYEGVAYRCPGPGTPPPGK